MKNVGYGSIRWSKIHDFLLCAGSCRSEEELHRTVVRSVGSLIPHDCGAATYHFERNTVRLMSATDNLEAMRTAYNEHYRLVFPIPVSYLVANEGTDFTPWENTEYVADFIRPGRIWSGLSLVKGAFQVGVYRTRSAPEFTARDRAVLRIIQPHLNNVYRHLRTLAATRRARINAAELDRGARPLTRREAEVAQCLARRMTAREIGMFLSMSHRTVERHIQNMYDKLGVFNRTELLARLST